MLSTLPFASATALRVLLALAVAGILSLLVALSAFAHPLSDDFCYAVKVAALGFAEAQRHAYEAVNGRYTATAALGAFASMGDIVRSYPVGPMLALFSTFAAFAFLVFAAGRGCSSRRDLLLAAGALTVVYVSMTPDPAQTFYWWAGVATYQLGNILVTILAALLVLLETGRDASRTRRVALLVGAAPTTVAAVGTNEVSLLITVGALACGSLLAMRKRRATRYVWLALLLVALAAAAVSIASPGNFIRAATIGIDGQLRPPPLWAALAYLPWVALRILYWLSNVGVWASAFLLFLVTHRVTRPIVRPGGVFDSRLLFIPAAWIVALFLLSAIGFVANRYPLPERAESVVGLAFLLGWYPSFVILAHWALGEELAERSIAPRIATIALVIGILGSPTIFEAYKAVYRGYRYHQEMQARWHLIRIAATSDAPYAVIPSLSRPPRLLFVTDFVTDPANFRNSCAAEYFGIASIRLGTPP